MIRLVLLSIILIVMPFKAHAYESAGQKFNIQVLTQQKDSIWGFDFLPDGRIVFTEQTGALGILNAKTGDIITIKNVPDVAVKGQGGLLDVRVHPHLKKHTGSILLIPLLCPVAI